MNELCVIPNKIKIGVVGSTSSAGGDRHCIHCIARLVVSYSVGLLFPAAQVVWQIQNE